MSGTDNIYSIPSTPASKEAEGELVPGTVRIDNVTKRFRKQTRARSGYSTIKSALLNTLFGKKDIEGRILTALDSVSIDIPAGTSIGIIGRNGSGKSSLLKLIAGIYRADGGSVSANGKVSALIELGAGFHPDFTGRENVYLGGVMYGLTRKEIDERFDAIVKYAELEDFIDDPVKTYSSGMYMRLGFSLAVHTDPDILLSDEVLAVGDAAFIHRCKDTISEFKRRGKTMIFVTHDLASVERWCDEAVWLHKGVVKMRGEPRQVTDAYLAQTEAGEEDSLKAKNAAAEPEVSGSPNRWGNGDVEITSVVMRNTAGEEKWLHHTDDAVTVEAEYVVRKPIEELVFGVGVLRVDGVTVFGTNTAIEDVVVPVPQEAGEARGRITFQIARLGLAEDSYYLDIAAHRVDGLPYDYHHRCYTFSVRSSYAFHGVCAPEHSWAVSASYEAIPEQSVKRIGA